jgi:hypothetical protein
MRTASPSSGSAVDRINSICISLAHIIDHESLAQRAPAWLRCLEQVATRPGGAGLAEACAWLAEVIATHPVLQEPAAARLRDGLPIVTEKKTTIFRMTGVQR